MLLLLRLRQAQIDSMVQESFLLFTSQLTVLLAISSVISANDMFRALFGRKSRNRPVCPRFPWWPSLSCKPKRWRI